MAAGFRELSCSGRLIDHVRPVPVGADDAATSALRPLIDGATAPSTISHVGRDERDLADDHGCEVGRRHLPPMRDQPLEVIADRRRAGDTVPSISTTAPPGSYSASSAVDVAAVEAVGEGGVDLGRLCDTHRGHR